MSLVPAETTAMMPLPYFVGSRCKTMARAASRYSAARTFFFTAANCFSLARVARMLPPCLARRAKIPIWIALQDNGAGRVAIFGGANLLLYGGELLFVGAGGKDVAPVFSETSEDSGDLRGGLRSEEHTS